MEIGDICIYINIYTYIYTYIYMVRARHFSSAGLVVCNVGGVKCQLFLKHSNYWKRTLKIFLNGTVRFGYCLALNLPTTALLR